MRFSSITALVALVGFSSASPNGWSKTIEAEDGPSKLDDCGCWPIYQAMLKCQKLKGPNANTDDCVCIPNPDGWYGSMDGCRNCLTNDSDEDFFDNVSRLVTQLFVSCTNAGGGVRSDGNSICASNSYREACVSLGTDGKASWASFEEFESNTKGNASYVLDISEFGADGESTTKGTTVKKTATTAVTSANTAEASTAEVTATASTEESTSTGSATSDATSSTETPAASASTTPSSAMNLAGTKILTGVISGVMVAVAVGAFF